jgi:hypothetical protein
MTNPLDTVYLYRLNTMCDVELVDEARRLCPVEDLNDMDEPTKRWAVLVFETMLARRLHRANRLNWLVVSKTPHGLKFYTFASKDQAFNHATTLQTVHRHTATLFSY